jgi:hypothetical protein
VTAAIKTSLNNLNQALESLETTAQQAQEKTKNRQKSGAPDLFSVPKTSNNDVDAKALASRLDGAIAKVEKLLREGDEAHG